jgi:hypothetical protein
MSVDKKMEEASNDPTSIFYGAKDFTEQQMSLEQAEQENILLDQQVTSGLQRVEQLKQEVLDLGKSKESKEKNLENILKFQKDMGIQ